MFDLHLPLKFDRKANVDESISDTHKTLQHYFFVIFLSKIISLGKKYYFKTIH